MLLRQKGVASPYTGWITTWESCVESPSSSSYEDVDSAEEEEDEGNAQEGHLIPVTTCITFEEDQEKGHPWLVGAGECKTGRFKVSGRLLSSTVFEGGVTFEMDPTDTAAPAEEEGWSCEACTFINEADAIRCNMCGTPKFGATWVCGACSYAYNGDHDPRCSMCNTLRTGQARGSSGAAKLSRCQTCKNTFDYVGLENLCLRAYCDVCKAVTEWLPVNSIRGTLKCHLTDGGDLMEGEIVLEGMRAGITGMVAKSYSEEALRALVVTHTPCEEKNYIYPLLQPHHHLSTCVARQDGFSLQQRLPSALVHYASRLVLLCAPYVKPDVIRNPRTIQDLGIDEEGWLDHLNILPREQARRSLATCLQVLLVKADSARCVHTAATLARSLLKSDKEFESQKHYFLYVLGMNALNVNKPTTVREECYRSMNHLFEDFVGSFMNSRCLVDAMGYLPTVGEQQRTTVFARLNGAPVTNVSSSTKAVYALVKLMDAMKHKTPLPRLLEHNVGVVLPHVVALADTQVNEAGDLLSGQVRGNIGVSAHQKGKYYFEMVVPPTVDERVVMGWGTLLHEQEASFQHVGADNHSWGFDCRDRLRIIGDEQRLRIVPPSAGDVIGSYVDMQSLTVAWSVNGREVGKVSMPYSGSSEIYPYVSGAVAPNAVQVRLTNTQFKPDGYSDYTFDDTPLWELNETAEPQDYEFYRSLCCLLEEANVTEVPSLKRLTKWLKASSHHSLWSKYPAVQRVLTSQSWSAEKLLYYIQVLQAVSDITVTVSHGFYIVENSPYLTQVYKKATSLLSSTSRWILFDTQVSSKLSVYMPHPRDVSLSIHVAQTIYDDNNSLLRFIYSVTYQLFSQLENAPVYRFPVMFVVNLWDYETIDVGGVTRSVLSMISDELNYRVENGTRIDPVLPLFKLCDHSSVFTIVPNSVDFMTEDDSLPDGETYANLQQRLLTWIGKLMGNIVLRGTLKLPLALPRLAWKYLTYDTPVIEDYFFDIDDKMRNSLLDDAFLMDTELYYSIPGVGRLQEEAIRYLASAPAVASPTSPLSPRRNSLLSSVTPTLSSSDLAEYEPPAQGGEEPVSEVERRRKIAEYALLHQYDVSLGAIRSGLASVIPPSALRNVRYGDLQTRVCGLSSVSAEQVLAFTDCSSLPEEVYGFFKKAITDLTDAGRSQFLLFCSGQRRLPLPEKIYVSCGDDPNLIPTAHTCSPISLLIQPYATLEQMKEKLNWSLYHGKEFGFA
ncbi:Zn-finger in Ran binding protein and others/SPRY domain/HECT-domain (ubiquitin-transferase), putative [Angomonas deanei]|uniref:Zn-finger in Ran binding protein and others/SPRY domain/HECT-domain (Ubiquitin-transferase), putative n=1 Tax=Angomonas deanei TaxID=59799 RepID=A0A7G2CN98_9TRYP|nr:Zn-finger in Ran binding protein and others/SPRY domain/HECT-domain (ubiquitin-transferase), putative [Angomonas deanei]